MAVTTIDGRKYWQFQNRYYWDDEGLKADQVHALLMTREQRGEGQVENTQGPVAAGAAPGNAAVLKAVSYEAKQYIWARDEGRCRKCGATNELQFNHIIPLAKGGSHNADNLQVLCSPCSRAKSSRSTASR